MKKLILSTVVASTLLATAFTSASAQTINYVDYTVQSGDTLWKISQAHNVSVAEIKEYNNKTNDMLMIGEHLKIPKTIHIVESGDTLWKVSQKYGVSIADIKAANNKTSDMLLIGEQLLIPKKSAVTNTTTQTVSTTKYHTVVSGDTLWKITQQYGVSLSDLRAVNNLQSDVILVGQKLIVPMTLTAEEKDLFARLVHSESKGEPYEGKVAVALVVLNRLHSSEFPNTVKDVIYETYSNGTVFAFSPVQNGTINESAGLDSVRAVEDALIRQYTDNDDSIFFYNPKIATDTWITTRPITKVIANHTFAK